MKTPAFLLPVLFLLLEPLAAADPARESRPARGEKVTTSPSDRRDGDTKSSDNRPRKAVQVTVSGELLERGSSLSFLRTSMKSLKDYLDTLRRARQDRNVQVIVLRLSPVSMGLGMALELHDAVEEARAAGKRVVALLEDGSQPAYLVACAADEIVMPPTSDLMLTGVSADAYFLKSLLSKLGITAHILHMGQYKAAGEMLTEDDFTTPARQNMEELVDDVYKLFTDTIAAGRKLEPSQVKALMDRGPMSAEEAREAGLVDRVAYADQVTTGLAGEGLALVEADDYAGSARERLEDISLFSLLTGAGRSAAPAAARPSRLPQVAVVYAVGPIMPGSSGSVLATEEEIAADDLLKTLEEIRKDDKIRAVILRVNSPGGSAFASDLIWRKIAELRREKPVVASLSDTAASGGYYIAMGATKIIAHPGTVTGSIGVVGGKLDLSGTYEKIGVRKTTISRGRYANLFSETGGFAPHERELIERLMRQTYDDFVAKAAEGRQVTTQTMDGLAQGKVWLGARAKEVGLVDELGGLPKAIESTKRLIGLTPDDKVELIAYPKDMSLMDVLQTAIGGGATVSLGAQPSLSAWLPVAVRPLAAQARAMMRLFQREPVLAVSPILLEIR
jgi:protease-4